MEFYGSPYKHPLLFELVSIPNGMEFYPYTRDFVIKDGCFNSQRDGILPMLLPVPTLIILVSIPNGMEFYIMSVVGSCMNTCFNSQRDGILLTLPSALQGLIECFNSQRDGILRNSRRG